jgi:hypothetical protein
MAQAKIASKSYKVKPPSDVLKRYLQGSMFTPRHLRSAQRGAAKTSKKGKQKISCIPGSVPTDHKGWVI